MVFRRITFGPLYPEGCVWKKKGGGGI